ncbi:NAD-dependent malic enzyme [Providencia burhodogranariea]|uniref:malate dehydrogenase (oxaloacetate-decarboxylating) n=1 Tax=Providencia burhodogranariea DSM 19968 TaxID=1141662 RepID=K8X5T5_9GAMM|nr:NAD-dependent malic enzyme [Providencia burhodogranariea]EKT63810.1 malate dehydrogenase [Providencia burhodogranariea DSM 19968]
MNYEAKENSLYIPYTGSLLLESPFLNKGSGFTRQEREAFNLNGLLPATIETIEEQSQRAYQQFLETKSDIARHIYLRNIQDTNETLFYYMVSKHISEMMPIIYTPVVGLACEHFSDIYRRARGLFISWPDRHLLDDILHSVTKSDIKIIVVTDGERILGLGDQGIGGMGIPIGKLSLYTVCGGINPRNTLPILLDVGTNNSQLLNDPLYMGWRHPRITGDEYFEFVEMFISAVKHRWPNVLLQFEDFAQQTAMPLLEQYQHEICCFNDDIQGTAAVTLSCLMAASRATNSLLRNQRIVFLGAGSAGCGIAEYCITQMVFEGLTEQEARSKVFMVDRFGLLTDDQINLVPFQQKLAQPIANLEGWQQQDNRFSLIDVIRNVKPTILIGVTGQPGLFSEEVISEMYHHCSHPIIMPLSNPTSRMEARPEDILRWTEGNAIIATGSPFESVRYNEEDYSITQCNNVYIFPGIGLGVVASQARRITESMLMAASRTLAELSPLVCDGHGSLLPDIKDIKGVTQLIAYNVAIAAQQAGVAANISEKSLRDSIDSNFWHPQYRFYKRTSF